MERPINDFDEEIYNQLMLPGLTEEAPIAERDYNEVLDEITGQEPLRYYDPLSPILNRRKMRSINDEDEFDGIPAFI